MTLFVTFPRILVIQRKIRASEAQTSSSGGCEIRAESKPRRGRLEREEGRGDTQLLPVTPAWDPLRGTPIGHTPGFVGARRARLGVDAPSAGTPPRAPVRGFPPTRRSTDRHTVIPRLRLCPRQDVMRPFTPHWVLTVGVAAGRGFTSTRYGFAFLTKHSKFTVCLSLLQTTGVLGEARPPRTAPARFHPHAACFCFSLSSPACRHRAAAYLQVPAVRPEGKGQPHA